MGQARFERRPTIWRCRDCHLVGRRGEVPLVPPYGSIWPTTEPQHRRIHRCQFCKDSERDDFAAEPRVAQAEDRAIGQQRATEMQRGRSQREQSETEGTQGVNRQDVGERCRTEQVRVQQLSD